MSISDVTLLFTAIFAVLGVCSALIAREAARNARSSLRNVANRLDECEICIERHGGWIKKLTQTLGGLNRGAQRPGQLQANGLPDPTTDTEAWRAAVRARAPQLVTPRKG